MVKIYLQNSISQHLLDTSRYFTDTFKSLFGKEIFNIKHVTKDNFKRSISPNFSKYNIYSP